MSLGKRRDARHYQHEDSYNREHGADASPYSDLDSNSVLIWLLLYPSPRWDDLPDGPDELMRLPRIPLSDAPEIRGRSNASQRQEGTQQRPEKPRFQHAHLGDPRLNTAPCGGQ
jgi:hypothetical protein